jgi:hypothetical protein
VAVPRVPERTAMSATPSPAVSPAVGLTRAEAARRLGVSPIQLYRIAGLGRIRVIERVGRPPRYNEADVDRVAADQAAAMAGRDGAA